MIDLAVEIENDRNLIDMVGWIVDIKFQHDYVMYCYHVGVLVQWGLISLLIVVCKVEMIG